MATTTTQPTTLSDVIGFITGATSDQLDLLSKAINDRRQSLRNERAALVKVGMKVVLSGVSPKYLDGMTGTVDAITGTRATVRLDEESTNRLRLTGRRFLVPSTVREYELQVPLAGLEAA